MCVVWECEKEGHKKGEGRRRNVKMSERGKPLSLLLACLYRHSMPPGVIHKDEHRREGLSKYNRSGMVFFLSSINLIHPTFRPPSANQLTTPPHTHVTLPTQGQRSWRIFINEVITTALMRKKRRRKRRNITVGRPLLATREGVADEDERHRHLHGGDDDDDDAAAEEEVEEEEREGEGGEEGGMSSIMERDGGEAVLCHPARDRVLPMPREEATIVKRNVVVVVVVVVVVEEEEEEEEEEEGDVCGRDHPDHEYNVRQAQQREERGRYERRRLTAQEEEDNARRERRRRQEREEEEERSKRKEKEEEERKKKKEKEEADAKRRKEEEEAEAKRKKEEEEAAAAAAAAKEKEEFEAFLSEGAPQDFLCPLSLHLFEDPVVALDPFFYSGPY